MTIFFLLDSMFAKKLKKHCFDDQYGSYDSLDEALFVCAMDENCEKIYDNGCVGGPYTLCPLKSVEMASSGSCLYMKPGTHGNTILFHTHRFIASDNCNDDIFYTLKIQQFLIFSSCFYRIK